MTANLNHSDTIQPADQQIADRTVRKVYKHVLPFILLCYLVAYVDRTNVGFAALRMNHDLGLTPRMYAFGGGIFFIGYMLFEIPSNWAIARVGARLWLSRIMITWGLVAVGMVLASGPHSFYLLRFLLGLSEAGFYPGVIFYLTTWFPIRHRNRVMGLFILGVPLSFVAGAPLSGFIMSVSDGFGIASWKWLFVLEGAPAIVLGLLCLKLLSDGPAEASWLMEDERAWLQRTLAQEAIELRLDSSSSHTSFAKALLGKRVWAAGFAYMGINFGLYGISLWLPLIIKNFGMGNAKVGLITTLPYALATVVIVLWTRHADRSHEQRWHAVIPCIVGAIGLAASAQASNPVLSITAFAIATAGIITSMPTLWALVTKSIGGAGAAGGIAMVNTIGQFGGFGGPYLVGAVRESTGSFVWGMNALGLCLVASAIILFFVSKPASRPISGSA